MMWRDVDTRGKRLGSLADFDKWIFAWSKEKTVRFDGVIYIFIFTFFPLLHLLLLSARERERERENY